jgi:hypothetical protein
VHDVYVEGGLSIQRAGLDGGPLPTRSLRLHFTNDHLDTALSWTDVPQTPPTFGLEATANLGRLRLHAALSRENGTGNLGMDSALMASVGPAQTGLFFGGHSGQGYSAGILSLFVF